MIRILTTLILISFISCNEDKVSTEIKNEIKTIDTIQKTKSKLSEPVDIVDLKSLEWLTTTSGVVPHSELKNLCVQNDSLGFYGFYFLIDKTVVRPIETLKIHTSQHNKKWNFDSKKEQFVEINLTSNKITIWDSIKVGLSEEKLKQFIGERFHYKKGTMIYSDLDSYEGIFIIANDTIIELTIKNKCGI